MALTNDATRDIMHKLVTQMLNTAIIEIKLLEDIITDKDVFITLVEQGVQGDHDLTVFQTHIFSGIILEAADQMLASTVALCAEQEAKDE